MNYKLNFLFALVLCFTLASFLGCNPDDDDIMIDPVIECDSLLVNIMMTPDSTLVAIAEGGAEPYTFLWSTGETGSEVNMLENGTYSVTVTDSNDCTATATFDIDNPEPCTLTTDTILVSEDSITGNYTLTAGSSGGVAPFSYLWSTGETGNVIIVGSLVDTLGYFTVEITDAMGCVVITSVTIEGNPDPCGSFSASIYVDSLNTTGLIAAVYGGTPPYAYTWSDGSSTGTIDNPMAGTSYSLTVTDSNGCSAVSSFTYSGNEPCSFFTSYINAYQDSVGVDTTVLISNANGGLEPYSYAWSQGSTDYYIYVANNSGTYSVTVTDQNGCVSENQIEL